MSRHRAARPLPVRPEPPYYVCGFENGTSLGVFAGPFTDLADALEVYPDPLAARGRGAVIYRVAEVTDRVFKWSRNCGGWICVRRSNDVWEAM